ncbi:hypothetical protein BG006_006089 [Podila minutissima]|uniref:Arrestin C-terminal-like domain-containing protein n=1 Tax=Podila minutissima TaxID=64525 RepID=A0A9P5SJ46_9FUNG|nr:hypothetical protein BG006_006089 [Podila minutissima]
MAISHSPSPIPSSFNIPSNSTSGHRRNNSTAGTGISPRSGITLVFAQGGNSCVLRPNAVVRGHVELRLIKPCYAAGIRVRLRAEESAIVLAQESNGDSLRQKFQQTVITLFEAEAMVSGFPQNDNELSNWEEIAPGTYSFPFALKIPNVNFPPCIPSLDGFSIRYVWTAQVEGPFEAGLTSEEVLCQFMPYVLAPKPMEWIYHDTVSAALKGNSTHQLNRPPSGINISIKMHQQIYIPGDPLSMATTIVNNTPHKVAGIDVILRQTVKGHMPTSYADLSNQAQAEFMAESVECKVRAGETGQADILTTIPPSMGKLSIPTFESNFIKVYYELVCVIRVKRSVFSGGDTTYQTVIPLPIATHNIDNPMISGRTPRWTKTRLQPYFFEPSCADPMGDLPGPSTSDPPSTVEPFISTVRTGMSPSVSASSLVTSPTTTTVGPNAMQEFLSGGSVELYRERTLKRSLTRSKSLKDIQSSRLNGSSWRAEREREQQRDMGLNSQLNRSATDVSQPATSPNYGPVKRSPPLVPKSRSSNDDKRPTPTSTATIIDSYVPYTPPPPSITPRSQRNPREPPLTAEQQVELARKASRRILPNQGSYTNEGILPPEPANPETPPPPTPALAPVSASPVPTQAQNNSGSPTKPSSPTIRFPAKRNASLSERSHLQQLNSTGSNSSTSQDTYLNEATGSRGRYNDQANSPPTRQDRYDQQGSTPLPAPERVPYQHSLPAHQQPPGVVSTSTPLAGSLLERSPSRRDVPTTNGSLSNLSSTAADFLPPPSFNKVIPSGIKDSPESTGNGVTASTTSTHTYSSTSSRIPPWERVEKVHHQNWFRPGPHQTGALTTFDAVGVPQATLQPIPIMKRSLPAPMEPIRSLEVEDQLR